MKKGLKFLNISSNQVDIFPNLLFLNEILIPIPVYPIFPAKSFFTSTTPHHTLSSVPAPAYVPDWRRTYPPTRKHMKSKNTWNLSTKMVWDSITTKVQSIHRLQEVWRIFARHIISIIFRHFRYRIALLLYHDGFFFV